MLGKQEPRIVHLPRRITPAGQEAIELAALAGLKLDDWQKYVLSRGLAERANGKWAAFEVGVVAPRQNGKNSIFEARELAGLFLLGERLIVHSAHQFDTSLEAFRRLLELIETADFTKRVKRVSRSHGEEGIELKTGQRIRFRTRTKGGGRGFSGDTLVVDEAMIYPEATHGALLPTLAARPNSQVWYGASAVDQLIHDEGRVLTRLRDRALRRSPGRLAYFEWSLEADDPDDVDDELIASPEAWAIANPALGIRISTEHIEAERDSMDDRTFAVERLGVGDWPNLRAGDGPIDVDQWLGLVDKKSKTVDGVCFAFDVSPKRERAAIAVAGQRRDSRGHIEIVEHRKGTGWLVDRLVNLGHTHSPIAIVCAAKSPAAALVPELEKRGIKVKLATLADEAVACGLLFDAVDQRKLRHLGTAEMTAALRGASKRQVGDAWTWSRRTSGTDISPLFAGTLAFWGHATAPKPPKPWGAVR